MKQWETENSRHIGVQGVSIFYSDFGMERYTYNASLYVYLSGGGGGGFNQYHLYHHDALCLVYIQMVIQDYSIQN